VIYHFDKTNNEWNSIYNYANEITSDGYNRFKTLDVKLNNKNLPETGPSTGVLQFRIHNTFTSATNYETTYFDNVQIIPPNSQQDSDDYNLETFVDDGSILTTKKTFNDRFVTEFPTYYRTRDNYGTNPSIIGINQDTIYKNPHIIKNQNVLNDYRSYVTRYQGTFRNLKVKPLSIHNKIWFNWTGIIEDEQAAVIDGLDYDIKSAEYKIKAHVPNDDDDVDSTIRIS
jgi:hypothetical protein